VIAAARGFIYGPVIIQSSAMGQQLDCRQEPRLIPSLLALDPSVSFSHSAIFILVVEKEGIFRQLVSDKFCSSIPTILITGQGFPSVACRALLAKLCRASQLPVFGLFDFNPHGFSIFFTFKFGSAQKTVDSTAHAVPHLKWIGQHECLIPRFTIKLRSSRG